MYWHGKNLTKPAGQLVARKQTAIVSTLCVWACTPCGHGNPLVVRALYWLYGVISLAQELLINQTAEGKIGDSRHPARADEGPTCPLQSRFLPTRYNIHPLLSQFGVVLKPGDTLRRLLQPKNKIPLGSPWDDLKMGTGLYYTCNLVKITNEALHMYQGRNHLILW